MFKSPRFWNAKDSLLVRAFSPLSKAYSFFNAINYNKTIPVPATVPVLCVGNIVMGGAGKTPTVELVCDILKNDGLVPHILSSGYGGYLKNVVKVDPELHSYLQVGDEALLSARVAPTWVGKNRINSSRAATISGANVLVLDDGFQNNSLIQDLKILVVDSGQEFGNEKIFPAGPLRVSVESGLRKSDVVLVIGDKSTALETKIQQINPNTVICNAKMKVVNEEEFAGQQVIGFCGLGYPGKFYKTLKEIGFDIKDFIAFSDHHPYTITEAQKLIKAARNAGAKLVTTMKDYIKIPDVFKHELLVINIKLQLEGDTLTEIIRSTIGRRTAGPTHGK
ncbi:MAG: tetraacyldisaccharide 4'-kinase [Holosporales bacterium]|jgi:tetraacyldisaccharide 4'-kinase|nr:tetraacyldisaccharide 4'-kinase [Holosporales bacterium]